MSALIAVPTTRLRGNMACKINLPKIIFDECEFCGKRRELKEIVVPVKKCGIDERERVEYKVCRTCREEIKERDKQ